MSTHGTALRHFARRLAAHAARRLPEHQAAWGRAMVAEVEHVTGEGAALGWAIGSLWAAYAMRRSGMQRNSQTSGPLLALAMLACFGWLIAVFARALAQVCLAHSPFTTPLVGVLLGSLLGPVALAGAITLLARPTAVLNRGVLIVFAAAGVANVALLGSELLMPMGWRDYVLCVVLPLVGTAYLARLGSASAARSEAT